MILKYPMMGWKFFCDATLNNLREKMMQSKTVLTELETVKSADIQKPWAMEEFEDLLKPPFQSTKKKHLLEHIF